MSPTPELEQQLLSHDEDRWFRAPNKLTSDSELPHSSSVDRLVVLDVLVTSRLSPSEFSTDCTFETLDTFARCDVISPRNFESCPRGKPLVRWPLDRSGTPTCSFAHAGGTGWCGAFRVAQSPAVFSSRGQVLLTLACRLIRQIPL